MGAIMIDKDGLIKPVPSDMGAKTNSKHRSPRFKYKVVFDQPGGGLYAHSEFACENEGDVLAKVARMLEIQKTEVSTLKGLKIEIKKWGDK